MSKEILVDFVNTAYMDGDYIGVTLLHKKNSAGYIYNESLSKDQLVRFFEGQGWEQVSKEDAFPCWTPNTLKPKTTHHANNVAELNAIFLDIDGGDLPAFSKHAHYIFSRGHDRHHLYFFIDRLKPTNTNVEKFKITEKSLIDACNGDPSVHNISRLLRIPYSLHVKDSIISPGYELKQKNDLPRYKLEELLSVCAVKEIKSAPLTGDLVEPAKKSTFTKVPTNFDPIEFLTKVYARRSPVKAGDGRSRLLLLIGFDCNGWGLDYEDALAFARKQNEVLCLPPESEKVIEHQIRSAYKYGAKNHGKRLAEFLSSDNAKNAATYLKKCEDMVYVAECMKQYVYIRELDILIDTEKNIMYGKLHSQNMRVTEATKTQYDIRTIVQFDAIQYVDKYTFEPAENKLFTRGGLKYYNSYKPPEVRTDLKKEDIEYAGRIFDDHIKYLTNNEEEHKVLLSYMAHIVQHPGKKILWAPLHINPNEGTGRSTLFDVMYRIFGDYVGQVDENDFIGNFNGVFRDKIVVCAQELAQGNKYGLYRKLKPLITENVIGMREKHLPSFQIKNTVNFLMFSNEKDAIKIEGDSRRLFVIYKNNKKNSAEYYRELKKVTENYTDELREWLLQVDLSEFDIYNAPYDNGGIRQLIEANKSELDLYLDEKFEEAEGPYSSKIQEARSLHDYVNVHYPVFKNRNSIKSITKYFEKNGYSDYRVMMPGVSSKVRKRVWFKGTEEECKAEAALLDGKIKKDFEGL